ncbi:hypothetical protein ACX1HP_16065, partial [Yersinia pseudotuberculosis]
AHRDSFSGCLAVTPITLGNTLLLTATAVLAVLSHPNHLLMLFTQTNRPPQVTVCLFTPTG